MLTFKLAISNMKKGFKSFAPFLLATTTMFVLIFVTASIGLSKSLLKLTAGGGVGQMMLFAMGVLTIFAVIILVYSYRFLQLQRSKEFGLYDILGFGKVKIATVAFFELLLSYLLTVFVGSLIGIALGKFLFLIFVNLVGGATYNLAINPLSVGLVAFIFLLIFLLLFINGCLIIWRSSSLDLLREESKGEKEPKSNIFLAILGIVLIAAGYIIAIGVQNAVAAFSKFFIAVLLVIFGTYFFYVASTIWYLKWRKKRDSYYQPRNFISISSLLYRMKANAVGLGNITILLSMAVVTIVTTVGMYFGTSSVVQQRFPKEGQIIASNPQKSTRQDLTNSLESMAKKAKINLSGSDIFPIKSVDYMVVAQSAQTLNFTKNSQDENVSHTFNASGSTLQDLKKLGNSLRELADNQVIIYDRRDLTRNIKQITSDGQVFEVKSHLKTLKNFPDISQSQALPNSILIIFPNDAALDKVLTQYNQNRKNGDGTVAANTYALFDIKPSDEAAVKKVVKTDNNFDSQIDGNLILFRSDVFQSQRQAIGGFVFIGFVLGISFILGAALIIYYKQLSEGAQDKRSFKILQEVGLSKIEVQKTIQSQVRMIFFLPIVVTIVHFGFAYNMVSKILEAFGIYDASLMLVISTIIIAVVAILYWLIYKLTSRVYYRIVER